MTSYNVEQNDVI